VRIGPPSAASSERRATWRGPRRGPSGRPPAARVAANRLARFGRRRQPSVRGAAPASVSVQSRSAGRRRPAGGSAEEPGPAFCGAKLVDPPGAVASWSRIARSSSGRASVALASPLRRVPGTASATSSRRRGRARREQSPGHARQWREVVARDPAGEGDRKRRQEGPSLPRPREEGLGRSGGPPGRPPVRRRPRPRPGPAGGLNSTMTASPATTSARSSTA